MDRPPQADQPAEPLYVGYDWQEVHDLWATLCYEAPKPQLPGVYQDPLGMMIAID